MKPENKTMYIGIITAAVIAGCVGFGAGMKYQMGKRMAFGAGGNFGNTQFGRGPGGLGGANAQGRGGVNRGAFRPVTGEIISSDDKSITVKLQDGSSKIVFIGESTAINKADKASKTDLTTGKQVAVFGLDNSDGSVTAQSIQLDPMNMRLQMNGSGTPSSSPKS